MTGLSLSARLQAVADMVSPGLYVYDVGCDHGFLSIYLVGHAGAPGAVASDVNPGPLKVAREHVTEEGLDDRIRLVLSNGLLDLDKPVKPSALVIAGMGGPLILDILGERPDMISAFDEIIISPQSCIEDVRSALPGMGLYITDESMVLDAGKYYTVIKLKPEENTDGMSSAYGQTDPELDELLGESAAQVYNLYGYKLIKGAHPVLADYLKAERKVLEGVLSELDSSKHAERYEQVTEDIRLNGLVCKWMEGRLYGNDHD